MKLLDFIRILRGIGFRGDMVFWNSGRILGEVVGEPHDVSRSKTPNPKP